MEFYWYYLNSRTDTGGYDMRLGVDRKITILFSSRTLNLGGKRFPLFAWNMSRGCDAG